MMTRLTEPDPKRSNTKEPTGSCSRSILLRRMRSHRGEAITLRLRKDLKMKMKTRPENRILRPLLFTSCLSGPAVFLCGDQFMSGLAQQMECSICVVLGNENVVGFVSRNCEDRDIVCRERFNERQEHSSLRERKRAFELEANPMRPRLVFFRNVPARANNREFVSRASDRSEFALHHPVWNNGAGCESQNRIGILEL